MTVRGSRCVVPVRGAACGVRGAWSRQGRTIIRPYALPQPSFPRRRESSLFAKCRLCFKCPWLPTCGFSEQPVRHPLAAGEGEGASTRHEADDPEWRFQEMLSSDLTCYVRQELTSSFRIILDHVVDAGRRFIQCCDDGRLAASLHVDQRVVSVGGSDERGHALPSPCRGLPASWERRDR